MRIHIGFTGTQTGATPEQHTAIDRLLRELLATDLHHGDCLGADHEAHMIARDHLDLRVHLHIPINDTRRARCVAREGIDVVYPPLPYLERNRAIVDATAALIAAPKEMAETLRSGTWSTIRYARRQGKPVHIVWPDGSVSQEPHHA